MEQLHLAQRHGKDGENSWQSRLEGGNETTWALTPDKEVPDVVRKALEKGDNED